MYDRLIKRLLTGYWRDPHHDNRDDVADSEVLHRQLRDWAWQAAANHPRSGLGAWQETFPTPSGTLAPPARDLLDHIATATGPRDIDTDTIPRRFIHRSIHEHLVAQHLTDPTLVPLVEAADELLPHLWFDPDWEYPAPAAIAARDDRDELLRLLLCRAARAQNLPPDLSVIEAGSELHRFVGRLATETDETDWSPEIAQLIGQARLQLSQARQLDLVGATAHWTTTNAAVRAYLLDQFSTSTRVRGADAVVSCLVQLAAEPHEKAHTRAALLDKLTTATDNGATDALVVGLAQLDPTPQDQAVTRAKLLELLTDTTDSWTANSLVSGLAQLDPTPRDQAVARARLLDQLTSADARYVEVLASGLVQLDPTPRERTTAWTKLLELLDEVTDDSRIADALALRLVPLTTEPDDKAQARAALMDHLAGATNPRAAKSLVSWLVQLDPTPQDKTTARTRLLELLADTAGSWAAEALASGLVLLDPTPQDKTTALAMLLELLADPTNRLVAAEELGPALVRLATEPEDKARARAALVADLAQTTTSGGAAQELMSWLAQLDPTPHDLVASQEWATVPSSELLQAARRNASLDEWLQALPC